MFVFGSFLALQVYLNLIALVFASWNVGASKAAEVHGEFFIRRWSIQLHVGLTDYRGWWFDSRWSVCLHNFQRHRDIPLYHLVRVPSAQAKSSDSC